MPPLMRLTLGIPLIFLSLASTPQSASAGHSMYTQIGLGYGSMGGSELVTKEDDTVSGDMPLLSGDCCPGSGMSFDLRLGFAVFDAIAPEFGLTGYGWGFGSENGGAGFIGGGLRLFPLGIAKAAADVSLGVPLGLSFGLTYGWSIVGDDFAYTGNYISFDAAVDYALTESFSLGAKFIYIAPSYGAFQYTDYDNNTGRCLDSTSSSVDPSGTPYPIQSKDSADCGGGSGPSTSFVGLQLLATFTIPLFE